MYWLPSCLVLFSGSVVAGSAAMQTKSGVSLADIGQRVISGSGGRHTQTISFCSKGQRLVCFSSVVRILELPDWRHVQTVKTQNHCKWLAHSRDGKLLATLEMNGKGEEQLFIRDAVNGEVVRRIHEYPPNRDWTFGGAVVFSDDNRSLIGGLDGGWVRWFDVETGIATKGIQWEAVDRPRRSGIGRVALAPNGKLLAVGGDHGSCCVFDLVKQEQLKLPAAVAGAGEWLVFSPDSSLLAAAHRSIGVYILDLAQNRVMDTVRLEGWLQVAFVPKRNLLAITNQEKVVLYDLGKKVIVREFGGQVTSPAFSPDGQWMAAYLDLPGIKEDGVYVWKVDDLLKAK
jgi:WD40 repeat protein